MNSKTQPPRPDLKLDLNLVASRTQAATDFEGSAIPGSGRYNPATKFVGIASTDLQKDSERLKNTKRMKALICYVC